LIINDNYALSLTNPGQPHCSQHLNFGGGPSKFSICAFSLCFCAPWDTARRINRYRSITCPSWIRIFERANGQSVSAGRRRLPVVELVGRRFESLPCYAFPLFPAKNYGLLRFCTAHGSARSPRTEFRSHRPSDGFGGPHQNGRFWAQSTSVSRQLTGPGSLTFGLPLAVEA
jgi:hypothetical protein